MNEVQSIAGTILVISDIKTIVPLLKIENVDKNLSRNLKSLYKIDKNAIGTYFVIRVVCNGYSEYISTSQIHKAESIIKKIENLIDDYLHYEI